MLKSSSSTVTTTCPYSDDILLQMDKDYKLMTPAIFAREYCHHAYEPAYLKVDSRVIAINMNHCLNPFCVNYGMPQGKFNKGKHDLMKYTIGSSKVSAMKTIMCNRIPNNNNELRPSLSCSTYAVSNWSVTEEMKRLISFNSLQLKKPQYNFHKEDCASKGNNPFDNIELFYKYGKSSGNSQKYQCKTCKKLTNVLPSYRENFSYDQNKNDILPLFVELLMSRVPVKKSCKILKISPKTYYHKLEWVYRKCLEFLERHETNAFNHKELDSIWLNTDKMVYRLNNVRKKGKGGIHYNDEEESAFQTFLIASSDLYSRYVFRTDIAYDFTITQEQIEEDTVKYHEDHLHSFARKNERLRIPFAPQPPSENDHQSVFEYNMELYKFDNRKNYIDGMHVDAKYTAIAHYWLIKEMIKCKHWNFISDEDSSLINSVMRVFVDSISTKESHYFLCKVNSGLTKKEAYNLHIKASIKLKQWAKENGFKKNELFNAQKQMIAEAIKSHNLYDYKNRKGLTAGKRSEILIEHPHPSIDEGVRHIGCITDISDKSIEEIAGYLARINSRSINTFFNQVRRSISILERPLTTSRHDKKSYIYTNYNPKYAQYSVTILRTFYNFCWAYKSKDCELLTPAQRIGITNKQFEYKDIIYFS